MIIDRKAPLIGRKEIIINAPINHVWKIQSDIENWSKWQKEISSVKMYGNLKKGSVFKWKAMGISISSVLQSVERDKEISWTGNSIGMHAIHCWYFQKTDNKTKVITEESLSGWFPLLIKIFKPNFLETSLQKTLETLKNYSENSK